MAAKRWTGNGLPDLTTIIAGNVNAPGNGSTVFRGASGTPTILRTEGDGFRVAAGNGIIGRLDSNDNDLLNSFGGVCQVFFTASGAPSAVELPVIFQNASTNFLRIALTTARAFRLQNAAGVSIDPGMAAYIDGNRYQIDLIGQLKTPGATTSNGRAVLRIRDLNNPTWNGTGEFYWDTGESINLGTSVFAQTRAVRVGKQVSATVSPTNGYLFEQFGWDAVSLPPAVTARADVEKYFIPSPYLIPAGYRWNGSMYVPQKALRWTGSAYKEVRKPRDMA